MFSEGCQGHVVFSNPWKGIHLDVKIACNYFTYRILTCSNILESNCLIEESAALQNRWEPGDEHGEINTAYKVPSHGAEGYNVLRGAHYSLFHLDRIILKNSTKLTWDFVWEFLFNLLLYHIKLMPLEYFIAPYAKADTQLLNC